MQGTDKVNKMQVMKVWRMGKKKLNIRKDNTDEDGCGCDSSNLQDCDNLCTVIIQKTRYECLYKEIFWM